MIVLDTNVVSETLRPSPDPGVLAWLDAQDPQTLFITSIGLAELLSGVERLPKGRRRTQLASAIEERMLPLFADRILGFDEPAAKAFAAIEARLLASGRPAGFADTAIAAIAQVHGCIIATRNVKHFTGTGAKLLNPWDA